jgi:hypothetical protein
MVITALRQPVCDPFGDIGLCLDMAGSTWLRQLGYGDLAIAVPAANPAGVGQRV